MYTHIPFEHYGCKCCLVRLKYACIIVLYLIFMQLVQSMSMALLVSINWEKLFPLMTPAWSGE